MLLLIVLDIIIMGVLGWVSFINCSVLVELKEGMLWLVIIRFYLFKFRVLCIVLGLLMCLNWYSKLFFLSFFINNNVLFFELFVIKMLRLWFIFIFVLFFVSIEWEFGLYLVNID